MLVALIRGRAVKRFPLLGLIIVSLAKLGGESEGEGEGAPGSNPRPATASASKLIKGSLSE